MKVLGKIIIIMITVMVSLRLIVMLADWIEEKRERKIFRDIEDKKRKEANEYDALCIEEFSR